MRCEDYPCCGHGPPPVGDGGGCPDSQGRFNCVTCGVRMPRDAPSAICAACRSKPSTFADPDDMDYGQSYMDRYEELCDPW